MAKKLSITLKIAGASYPFPEIDAADEEVYRRAEREVNRLFAEAVHPTLLPKDQLALAALELAVQNIRLRTSRSLGEELDRLVEIDRGLEEYLNAAK